MLCISQIPSSRVGFLPILQYGGNILGGKIKVCNASKRIGPSPEPSADPMGAGAELRQVGPI